MTAPLHKDQSDRTASELVLVYKDLADTAILEFLQRIYPSLSPEFLAQFIDSFPRAWWSSSLRNGERRILSLYGGLIREQTPLSLEEIAKVLQIQLMSAQSTFYRSRRLLRLELKALTGILLPKS